MPTLKGIYACRNTSHNISLPAIAFCCPYPERHIARAAGATWSPTDRAWKIEQSKLEEPDTLAQIARFLPARFRPDHPGPWLTPNVVPQSLWGKIYALS